MLQFIFFTSLACREQALKRRLAFVYDSLNAALPDSTSTSRESDEHVARIAQAHRYSMAV